MDPVPPPRRFCFEHWNEYSGGEASENTALATASHSQVSVNSKQSILWSITKSLIIRDLLWRDRTLKIAIFRVDKGLEFCNSTKGTSMRLRLALFEFITLVWWHLRFLPFKTGILDT